MAEATAACLSIRPIWTNRVRNENGVDDGQQLAVPHDRNARERYELPRVSFSCLALFSFFTCFGIIANQLSEKKKRNLETLICRHLTVIIRKKGIFLNEASTTFLKWYRFFVTMTLNFQENEQKDFPVLKRIAKHLEPTKNNVCKSWNLAARPDFKWRKKTWNGWTPSVGIGAELWSATGAGSAATP